MPNPDNLPANSPEIVPTDHAGEFHTIANLLLGKAWLIVLSATIGVLLAAYHLKKAPRIYQAAATVQVEEEEKKAVKVDSFMKEDLRNFEILNTIVQKFTSRPLLERVIETNRLTQNPAFVGPGNAGLFKKEDLVPLLQSALKVGLRRDTRLIDIVVSHTDPKLTAEIANGLAEQYMAQDIAFSSTATKGAYSYLRDESERLKKKLETSELALQKYKEEAGFVSLQHG
jgi:succinoglycan biosynthesis transport protein ExoP